MDCIKIEPLQKNEKAKKYILFDKCDSKFTDTTRNAIILCFPELQKLIMSIQLEKVNESAKGYLNDFTTSHMIRLYNGLGICSEDFKEIYQSCDKTIVAKELCTITNPTSYWNNFIGADISSRKNTDYANTKEFVNQNWNN